MNTYNFFGYTIALSGNMENFKISLSGREEVPGLVRIKLKMDADEETIPSTVSLSWKFPDIDIHSRWSPSTGFNRGIQLENWDDPFISKATSSAPVHTLLSFSGENKLTIAVSDALNPIDIRVSVNEETASFFCYANFFTAETQPLNHYEAELRLDTRNLPYYESLNQVQKWWASMSVRL